jgi:hypothetical protein
MSLLFGFPRRPALPAAVRRRTVLCLASVALGTTVLPPSGPATAQPTKPAEHAEIDGTPQFKWQPANVTIAPGRTVTSRSSAQRRTRSGRAPSHPTTTASSPAATAGCSWPAGMPRGDSQAGHPEGIRRDADDHRNARPCNHPERRRLRSRMRGHRTLCRQLACELGPQGVRVVCLRSAGSPDAPGLDEIGDRLAERAGVTSEELEASFEEATLLRRLPMLAEVGNMAALMALDLASPMTGTVADMTCGAIVD